MKNGLNDYRCDGCKKLMFKGFLVSSEVEVKCKRCGQLNTFKGQYSADMICLNGDCPRRMELVK